MFDRSMPARAALTLVFGAAPLAAGPMSVDAVTVAAGLKALTLPAERTTIGSTPGIDSTFGENEAFTVYLLECDDQQANCKSVQFWAGFTDSKAGVQEMNAFNLKYRFGRGMIDETGEPALVFDLPTSSFSDDEFKEAVGTWQRLIGAFSDAIYPADGS